MVCKRTRRANTVGGVYVGGSDQGGRHGDPWYRQHRFVGSERLKWNEKKNKTQSLLEQMAIR